MATPAPEPFRVQVLDKLSSFVTAAFALVAALAWNAAIGGLINEYYASGSALVGLFVYAVVVTIIAVLAAVWIARLVARARTMTLRPRA